MHEVLSPNVNGFLGCHLLHSPEKPSLAGAPNPAPDSHPGNCLVWSKFIV